MKKLFYEFNINSDLKKICHALGYIKPSDIQKEILEHILEFNKNDIIVEENTNTNTNNDNDSNNYLITSIAGSGKTFSYLMCLFNKMQIGLKKLQGIILLPTRELALQTASYFERINNANGPGMENIKINYKVLVGGVSSDIISSSSSLPINSKQDLMMNDNVQVIIGTLGKIYSTFTKSFSANPNSNSKKNNYSYKNMNLNKLKSYCENLEYVIIDEADKLIHQNKDDILKKLLSMFYSGNKSNKSNNTNSNTNKTSNNTNFTTSLILVSASFDQKSINFYLDYIDKFKIIQRKSLLECESEVVDEINKVKKINNSQNSHTLTCNSTKFSDSKLVNSFIKEYYHIFKPEVKMTYFEQKYKVLFDILDSLGKKFKQCLIFYNQKGRGEELAADLREAGWATTFIHGDLTQDQRILIYDKIRNIQVKVILATDLFSRGIDLSTVDLVINFDSPFNETDYFHRVGRTGRYNSYGLAISFFQENETKTLDAVRDKDKDKDERKLILVNKFDKEYLDLFENDLVVLQSSNKINEELIEKVRLLDKEIDKIGNIEKEQYSTIESNSNNNNNNNNIEDGNQFVNRKRRRVQYEKESLVSEWVEVEKDLYDNTKFKYIDEEELNNNITRMIKSKEDKHKKCEYCLYCNFIKIFETGIIDNQ